MSHINWMNDRPLVYVKPAIGWQALPLSGLLNSEYIMMYETQRFNAVLIRDIQLSELTLSHSSHFKLFKIHSNFVLSPIHRSSWISFILFRLTSWNFQNPTLFHFDYISRPPTTFRFNYPDNIKLFPRGKGLCFTSIQHDVKIIIFMCFSFNVYRSREDNIILDWIMTGNFCFNSTFNFLRLKYCFLMEKLGIWRLFIHKIQAYYLHWYFHI